MASAKLAEGNAGRTYNNGKGERTRGAGVPKRHASLICETARIRNWGIPRLSYLAFLTPVGLEEISNR